MSGIRICLLSICQPHDCRLAELYNDQHFYDINSHGKYQFCVGVPESFIYMKNVILENVRTADKMLVAYELFQTGQTNKLELLAYSHGDKGQKEYKNERKKYKTK